MKYHSLLFLFKNFQLHPHNVVAHLVKRRVTLPHTRYVLFTGTANNFWRSPNDGDVIKRHHHHQQHHHYHHRRTYTPTLFTTRRGDNRMKFSFLCGGCEFVGFCRWQVHALPDWGVISHVLFCAFCNNYTTADE